VAAAAVDTYDDHRMAMCLSLAAFNPSPQLPWQRQPPSGGIPRPHQRSTLRRQDLPRLFETLFGVASADPRQVPVITIDGPTASGKGTLAARVADALGYHLLDSGALYRATGLASQWDGVAEDDVDGLARLAGVLDLRFGHGPQGSRTWLRGREVSEELRAESAGLLASRVSALGPVRAALQGLQLAFRCAARVGGRWPRHGNRCVSLCRTQGLPHGQRRTARRKTP
jgi:3-phosphoshikimate 1-carboxyvinyltransferase